MWWRYGHQLCLSSSLVNYTTRQCIFIKLIWTSFGMRHQEEHQELCSGSGVGRRALCGHKLFRGGRVMEGPVTVSWGVIHARVGHIHVEYVPVCDMLRPQSVMRRQSSQTIGYVGDRLHRQATSRRLRSAHLHDRHALIYMLARQSYICRAMHHILPTSTSLHVLRDVRLVGRYDSVSRLASVS